SLVAIRHGAGSPNRRSVYSRCREWRACLVTGTTERLRSPRQRRSRSPAQVRDVEKRGDSEYEPGQQVRASIREIGGNWCQFILSRPPEVYEDGHEGADSS